MSDPHHEFHTTRWSLISQMRTPGDVSRSESALAQLCERYWWPMHHYIRRRGIVAHDAEDLTQGFFQHLLSHELMAQAKRDRGRFRSFLLGCLKNYLNNEWQKSQALSRGGAASILHLDAMAAEERYQMESQSLSADEETAFDQAWAHRLLAEAQDRLRAELPHLEALMPAILGQEDRAALMHFTGMNEGALKVAVHRLRKRYREVLKQLVAETVADPAEVDSELAYLVACLRR